MRTAVCALYAQRVFRRDIRVRLYRDEKGLAYTSRLRRTTDVGTPDPIVVARDCGEKRAMRMRRYAS